MTSPVTGALLSKSLRVGQTQILFFFSQNGYLLHASVLYLFPFPRSPFIRHGVPIGYVAILLAVVASMGGFIFGYDTGQISDILLMDDFLVRFGTCNDPGVASTCHFTTTRAGLIVSLLSIGTLVGALMGAPYVDKKSLGNFSSLNHLYHSIADFLGRRYAMVVECIIFIIGVLIQIAATDVWQQFGVGRWVSGLGVGALSAAVPMVRPVTVTSLLSSGFYISTASIKLKRLLQDYVVLLPPRTSFSSPLEFS